MNLYEINQEILNCLDLETGEILDEEKLNQLQIEKSTKIENIGLWIKNLTSEINEIKAEEENLASRRKSKENKVESLKSYLQTITAGIPFETARLKVSFRKSVAVNIIDESKIDKKYITEVITTKVNKNDIKTDLKNGINIDGVVLVENQNIQIK